MFILKGFGRLGIRARFVILLAIAFIPLVMLLSLNLVSDYRTTIEAARGEVVRKAEILALRQSASFHDARTFLDTIRRLPEVTASGGPACSSLFTRLKEANPQFHVIGVVANDLMVTCHNGLKVVQKIGTPQFFARHSRPQAPDFNVGEFTIGNISGQPTVIASMRLPAVDGQSGGAVFVSMNLGLLSKSIGSGASGNMTAALVEMPAARLLARYPSLDVPFGSSVEGHPIVRAMRETGTIGTGVAEGIGQDGIEHMFGYVPLEGLGEGHIVASVALPLADILGAVHMRIGIAAIVCIAVLAVSCGGAWWIGYWTQIHPIGDLRRVAVRIGAGDLGARTTLEPWQAPELRSLGHAVDMMAEKLGEGRRAEEAVAESEARYRLLAENTADLVTSLDAQGRRIFVSPAVRDLIGQEPAALLGSSPQDIAHPDDLPIVEAMMSKLLSSIPVSGVQYRVLHRDGRHVWVEVSGKPIDGGNGTVLVIRDITERKLADQHLAEANSRLADLANTDGLTGLGNRRSFDDHLRTGFDHSAAERTDLSLVLIDVDWFKSYNDTYGHLQGDECLRLIAATIGEAARNPGDHAARFGGEELALVLPGTSVGDAIERGEAVRQAVEAMNLAHPRSPFGHVTISVGVVSVHGGLGYASPDAMLGSADQALYEVKANGRNGLRYAMPPAVKAGKRRGGIRVA